MELKIDDLVSSIKKEGIDAANAEAQKIIGEAQAKATAMIEEAKKEQEKIKEQNEAEIELLRESARLSIEQAKRDAVLLFEDAVKKRFEKILQADINKTVNGEALAALIKAALNGENPADYNVEISSVTDGLKAELANEVKNGLEIKISPSVKTGFRLSAKDGSGYFDCSNDEIANMISPFFSDLKI